MNNPNQTPAGWYGDDSGFDRKRFWDGQQGTEQYAYRDHSGYPALGQTTETVTPSGAPDMTLTTGIALAIGVLIALAPA